jgi:hypothetical protein
LSILIATPGRLTTDSLDSADVRWYGPKAWRMHGYLIGVAGSCERGDQRLEHDGELWPVTPSTRALRAAVANQWPLSAGKGTTWIVVTESRCWTIEGGYVYTRKLPHAIGCGASWALGRLDVDPTDPAAAVRFACKHDAFCGGRVRDLRLGPG